jgi:hypothetical protein
MGSDLSHKGRGNAPTRVRRFNFQTANLRHTFAISRRSAPEVCQKISALKTEGVGNAGRPMHPQPRVRYW